MLISKQSSKKEFCESILINLIEAFCKTRAESDRLFNDFIELRTNTSCFFSFQNLAGFFFIKNQKF